jgi:single-strand DNA-binding protein
MSFAKISIIGNLGADPELKYTADGKPRLEMRVATNERRKSAGGEWEDKTTWYRVIMFGERSVKLAEWLRKGRKVYAEGRLQVDLYDSKEGEKRVALDILASEVVIVDRNPDADPGAPRPARAAAPSAEARPDEGRASAPSDLDDLPF